MAEYAVTLIPSPLGAAPARATSINAKGQIVGYSYRPDNSYHGFLWDNGNVTDLGTLSGGHVSAASDINDAGQICGWSDAQKLGPARAFLWHNGVMKDLGVIGGASSIAEAVNAAGEVAGESTVTEGVVHAFKWSNGVMHDLGALGGQYSRGHDINDAGDVVGDVGNTAFLHSGGSMVAIPSFQSAYAINNAGEIVGGPEACFRDAMGNIIPAPGVQGESVAASLNDSKRVVGWVYTEPSSVFAFRWDVATQDFENLNDLVDPLDNGDTLAGAFDINQKGQIVGHTAQGVPFLLTPILHTPDVSRLAYVTILAGIIGGGGGIIRTPGGHIVPVPAPPEPWLRSSWNAMSPAKRDLLLGLAIDEVAALVADRRARREFRQAARGLIQSSAVAIAGVQQPAAVGAAQRTQPRRSRKFERP